MLAQDLYDFRKKYEFCSGNQLHEFFRGNVGDPSPRGNVAVDSVAATEFVRNAIFTMAWNNSSKLDEHCRQALQAWHLARSSSAQDIASWVGNMPGKYKDFAGFLVGQ